MGRIANLFALALIALTVMCANPLSADALVPEDVTSEFGPAELSRLFERVPNQDSCDFVMCDYSSKNQAPTYLKVRDGYRARYEQLVGEDSVDWASVDGIEPLVDLPSNPLSWQGKRE